MLKLALVLSLYATPAIASDFNLDSLGVSDLRADSSAAAPAPEPVPVPYTKAGYIQLTSSIKLKMDKEKGELTVGFPKVKFGDAEPDDRSYLFVKMTRGLPEPAISWATVLCSGGKYLGYKGSNIDLPRESGSLSVSETLALGYPGVLISRTHAWLAGEAETLDGLCAAGFLEKMKDARAETLPQKLGDFSFSYDQRRNTLKVKW